MKCTWIIHQVCDGERLTYHTHGLEKYGSLELELNLFLNPRQAGQFVNLIAQTVADGKKYHSGQRVDDIFTIPFYLLETAPIHGTYEGERVLRIIFSDENLRYPWQPDCGHRYRDQLSTNEIVQMVALLSKENI